MCVVNRLDRVMLACAVCSNGARIRGHRSHVLPAGGSEDRSVQSGFVFLLERGQEAVARAAGNTKLGPNACTTLVHSGLSRCFWSARC